MRSLHARWMQLAESWIEFKSELCRPGMPFAPALALRAPGASFVARLGASFVARLGAPFVAWLEGAAGENFAPAPMGTPDCKKVELLVRAAGENFGFQSDRCAESIDFGWFPLLRTGWWCTGIVVLSYQGPLAAARAFQSDWRLGVGFPLDLAFGSRQRVALCGLNELCGEFPKPRTTPARLPIHVLTV